MHSVHKHYSWLAALLIALDLLEVHGPDGQIALVNTHEIATLREPATFDLRRHFAKGSRCIILTTDGKFLAVVETCAELRAALRDR